MAKATTIYLETTDPNGQPLSTPISYANPNATDTVLKDFAVACNNLTDNTYVDTLRVDKISLNESTSQS